MANVLVVYSCMHYPMRSTVKYHWRSFKQYASAHCYYWNLFVAPVPRFLKIINFDLIIFDTLFWDVKWNRERFKKLIKRCRSLARYSGRKIAIPQDEYINMDLACDFIKEIGIDQIYTVIPESEWKKVYRTVDFRRVEFFRVLTGYIDDELRSKIEGLSGKQHKRIIDIGYRSAFHPRLGSQGLRKKILADVFSNRVEDNSRIDIKLGQKNYIHGTRWYKFLLSCKYTLGVEGGVSLFDWDGTISERIARYLKTNPNAAYDEVENRCFRGLDGQVNIIALSPRQLEACLTKTCQILFEGEYNNVLQPDIHYIELKKDLRNLNKILAIIKDDRQREDIVDRAYDDVVASNAYSYRRFVDFILRNAIGTDKMNSREGLSAMEKRTYLLTIFFEHVSVIFILIYMLIKRIARATLRR